LCVDIDELAQIMAEHPWLKKPKFVYMVKEKVYGVADGYILLFKGATPIGYKDRIALTPDADDTTVVHEMLHLMGLGEAGAYVLAPVIRNMRKIIPPLVKRDIKLRKVGEPHPSVEVYEVLE